MEKRKIKIKGKQVEVNVPNSLLEAQDKSQTEITEEIRKHIHYDCECKGCERLRRVLDYFVGIDNAKAEQLEEIKNRIMGYIEYRGGMSNRIDAMDIINLLENKKLEVDKWIINSLKEGNKC